MKQPPWILAMQTGDISPLFQASLCRTLPALASKQRRIQKPVFKNKIIKQKAPSGPSFQKESKSPRREKKLVEHWAEFHAMPNVGFSSFLQRLEI
jgi:hypothetical protein